jgi:hypothetical protein
MKKNKKKNTAAHRTNGAPSQSISNPPSVPRPTLFQPCEPDPSDDGLADAEDPTLTDAEDPTPVGVDDPCTAEPNLLFCPRLRLVPE